MKNNSSIYFGCLGFVNYKYTKRITFGMDSASIRL